MILEIQNLEIQNLRDRLNHLICYTTLIHRIESPFDYNVMCDLKDMILKEEIFSDKLLETYLDDIQTGNICEEQMIIFFYDTLYKNRK